MNARAKEGNRGAVSLPASWEGSRAGLARGSNKRKTRVLGLILLGSWGKHEEITPSPRVIIPYSLTKISKFRKEGGGSRISSSQG